MWSCRACSAEIVGTVKTPDLEAVMACEPDLILMGGRMAEYYDELNEIAPTLRLTTVSDDGLVEAIRANAKTIGTIFGETEQVDALLAQYDARIAALAAFAEGKTCVLGMSTSGSFNLLGNDGRCSLIVNEVGFDNIGADARVSTDSEEQLTSYAAQVDYYTNYIRGRDDWEFVAVYTDEGITGTNTKHREGFKRIRYSVHTAPHSSPAEQRFRQCAAGGFGF